MRRAKPNSPSEENLGSLAFCATGRWRRRVASINLNFRHQPAASVSNVMIAESCRLLSLPAAAVLAAHMASCAAAHMASSTAAHMASCTAAHSGRGDTHGKRLVGLAKHKSLASPSGTLGCTRNYATTAICLFFYYPLHIYPFSDAYLFIYSVCAELPYPPPLLICMYFDQIMK